MRTISIFPPAMASGNFLQFLTMDPGLCERAAEQTRLAERKASEDSWVRLARLPLETYFQTGKRLKTLPADLPAEMTGQKAGAFVSLHIHGQPRWHLHMLWQKQPESI